MDEYREYSPHAMTMGLYTCDANGNMDTRNVNGTDYNLAYDMENRLASVTSGGNTIATYVYDGDGRRVKSTMNGQATYFINQYLEVSGNVWRKYYFHGAQRIAVSVNGDGENDGLYYLFADHLGSNSVAFRSDGTRVGELRYTAWGEIRHAEGWMPTQNRYTDQRSEAELGLIDYKARMYDPLLGRFASADTLVPGVGDPRNWDRYAYTRNNPVRYNDPSGHDVGCGGRDDGDYISYGKLNPTIIRDNILDKHNKLVASVGDGEDKITDLQALKQLADYAGSFTPNNPNEFIQNMGSVLTGHDEGYAARNELIIQIQNRFNIDLGIEYSYRYGQIRGNTELMQSGYAKIFQDPPGVGGNQARHFWFYVQVGF